MRGVASAAGVWTAPRPQRPGGGLVAGELVAWVRARYAAGQRRLVVTDWAGRQIGGISRRCWWADPTWPQAGPDNSNFEQRGG